MKKVLSLAWILICIFAVSVWSEKPTISYLEGKVELKSGNKWDIVDIGDNVAEDAVIRVADRGLLEVELSDNKIVLDKAGTYNLADLIKSSKSVSKWGIGNLIASKVHKFISGAEEVQNPVVMGARGEAIESNMEWIGNDDVAGLIAIGNDELSKKKYANAVKVFNEALAWSELASEKDIINYHIALAYSLGDNTALAQKYISQAMLKPGNRLYYDFVLLKSNLSIKRLAFSETLALLDEYLKNDNKATPDQLQTVYFLQSLCYDNLKNNEAKKTSLQNAYKIDPASKIGSAANELLTAIK